MWHGDGVRVAASDGSTEQSCRSVWSPEPGVTPRERQICSPRGSSPGFVVESVEEAIEAARAFGRRVIQVPSPSPWGCGQSSRIPMAGRVEVYQLTGVRSAPGCRSGRMSKADVLAPEHVVGSRSGSTICTPQVPPRPAHDGGHRVGLSSDRYSASPGCWNGTASRLVCIARTSAWCFSRCDTHLRIQRS